MARAEGGDPVAMRLCMERAVPAGSMPHFFTVAPGAPAAAPTKPSRARKPDPADKEITP
jgi:hypothetical protein